jgi:hypothetical protein
MSQQYPQQPPQSEPTYQQPYPQQQPPPAKKSGAGKAIAAVIIVVIVVIALIAALYFFGGQATLKINVNSEHILFSVDYELYIDGELQDSDSLSPGQYMEYTFTLHPGPSCATYNVFASSTGGGLGGESDSENVRLCNGETKSVDLYI